MRLRYSGEPVQIRIAQREKRPWQTTIRKKSHLKRRFSSRICSTKSPPRQPWSDLISRGVCSMSCCAFSRSACSLVTCFLRARAKTWPMPFRACAGRGSCLRCSWLWATGFSNRFACKFFRVTCFRNSVSAIRFCARLSASISIASRRYRAEVSRFRRITTTVSACRFPRACRCS